MITIAVTFIICSTFATLTRMGLKEARRLDEKEHANPALDAIKEKRRILERSRDHYKDNIYTRPQLIEAENQLLALADEEAALHND